ncbi:IS4 transposase [Halapricum desulfuricans]|uniref:IS4 transposase n=1 Tax=Halapricum desulfuricans TaxID=2841257 RepID=A0A897NPX1_9EURY|nr:IS4 transposase [Halapricum desulfuricans]
MMPITNFLSCTHVLDEFDSLSPAQRSHAKTYATGLVAASNKTVAGIIREVLLANSKRALNRFLTEYDWDEDQFNHERLEELQKHGETRWSKDGYIILDDTIAEKVGDDVPGVGRFYDHAEGDTVWSQDDDQDHDTKYDLTREIVTELEEEAGVRRHTYLFDSWFAHDSSLPEYIGSYDKDWIGPLRSNRQVTYGREEIRVDALEERIDTTERNIDDKIEHLFVHSTADANVQS